jgi:predicted NodU family carbamoyl transferase
MKKTLILIFLLFLLSSLNCATTKQEVSKTKTFDLSGTWILTEDMKGCGGKTNTSTVEIIQKGDIVTIVNSEDNKTLGKIYSDTIVIAGIKTLSSEGGVPISTEAHDHHLKISADANTLTGKVKFTLESASRGNCDGITILDYKRKPKE